MILIPHEQMFVALYKINGFICPNKLTYDSAGTDDGSIPVIFKIYFLNISNMLVQLH